MFIFCFFCICVIYNCAVEVLLIDNENENFWIVYFDFVQKYISIEAIKII